MASIMLWDTSTSGQVSNSMVSYSICDGPQIPLTTARFELWTSFIQWNYWNLWSIKFRTWHHCRYDILTTDIVLNKQLLCSRNYQIHSFTIMQFKVSFIMHIYVYRKYRTFELSRFLVCCPGVPDSISLSRFLDFSPKNISYSHNFSATV